jgi:ABC-2 type transport system permease protein
VTRFRALYKLFLRQQATRGRLLFLAGLGLVGIALGAAVGARDVIDHVRAGARLVDQYGLSLLAPVASLVFASSAIGDLVDDRTLVYLWNRPVNRLQIAAAASAASATICIPLVVVPMAIAAALTGGGGELILGSCIACTVAVVGYVGIFSAFGLRFRRALVWGIVYILLWEQFAARAGRGATKLAVLSYTSSVLSAYTGIGLRLGTLSVNTGIVVPLLVGVLAVLYTGRRLHHQDID